MATKTAISSVKKSTKIADPEAKMSTVETSKGGNDTVKKALRSIKKLFKDTPLVGSFIAEFIGTFLFTVSFIQMQSSPLFISFALIGIFLIIGGSIGIHLNPAITIGAWVNKKISGKKAITHVVAQALGAAAAWSTLSAFLSSSSTTTTTTSLFHAATITSGKEWYILFAELIGTLVLSLGFAAALKMKNQKIAAATTAGLALLVGLYFAMSLTTTLLSESYTTLTFLNPIIAFASSAISWNLWPIAIYILVPVLSGIIGFAIQDLLSSQADKNCDCEDTCSCKE